MEIHTLVNRHFVLIATNTLYLIENLQAFCELCEILFKPSLDVNRLPSGDTTVRETAPATPPAMKEATTGCAIKILVDSSAVGGGGGSSMPRGLAVLLRGLKGGRSWGSSVGRRLMS